MLKPFLAGLFLITTIWPAIACQQQAGQLTPTISFPAKSGSELPKEDYIFQLLQLVLDKSASKYGPCHAELTNFKAPIKRMMNYLELGQEVDVIALTVSEERDAKFLPVKIPIAKGLVGYRLLMINIAKVADFRAINSLPQLKKFVAGQGAEWPDVEILKHWWKC